MTKTNRLTAAVAARNHVRSNKTYRLVAGVPEGLRPSLGRRILVGIARRRNATAVSLRRSMPRGASDATLRFYLGKYQREGVVTSFAR